MSRGIGGEVRAGSESFNFNFDLKARGRQEASIRYYQVRLADMTNIDKQQRKARKQPDHDAFRYKSPNNTRQRARQKSTKVRKNSDGRLKLQIVQLQIQR